MKKITKKQNQSVLNNGSKTEIHKLISTLGINANNKTLVFNFIKNNAITQKVSNKAYSISYGRNHFKSFRCYKGSFENIFREPITSAIRFAKQQKNEGNWGNYSKKLFLGNKNIYWCSPVFGHSDYNKSIAFDNTEKNRIIAEKINKYLGY